LSALSVTAFAVGLWVAVPALRRMSKERPAEAARASGTSRA
jgi:hypothetical protein